MVEHSGGPVVARKMAAPRTAWLEYWILSRASASQTRLGARSAGRSTAQFPGDLRCRLARVVHGADGKADGAHLGVAASAVALADGGQVVP